MCEAALMIVFICSVNSLTPGLFLKSTDACSKYAKITAMATSADACAENKSHIARFYCNLVYGNFHKAAVVSTTLQLRALLCSCVEQEEPQTPTKQPTIMNWMIPDNWWKQDVKESSQRTPSLSVRDGNQPNSVALEISWLCREFEPSFWALKVGLNSNAGLKKERNIRTVNLSDKPASKMR